MSPRKKAEKAREKLAGKDRSAPVPLRVENVRTLKPTLFSSPPEWHAWLEEHHEIRQELWVGFHKKASGKPSITWPEAVDGALCFGWIDGVRKSLGDSSYVIRFTPRRPRKRLEFGKYQARQRIDKATTHATRGRSSLRKAHR